MAQVAGITTKKNTKGEITHVTINVKKHKEKIPILTEMGLMPKSKFMKEWEAAIADGAKSPEEFKKEMYKFIDELWAK